MDLDYYEIMGLSPTATTSEIKTRYKVLAKKYHPDHDGDNSTMSLVNRSYSILADPKLRFLYNQSLVHASKKQRPAAPAPPKQKRTVQSVDTKPPLRSRPKPKITFSPFASAGVAVIIVLLCLALAGLHQNQNNTVTFNPSSASSAGTAKPSTTVSGGSNAQAIQSQPTTPITYNSTPTPVAVPSTNTSSQSCENQQSQAYQQAASLEQQMSATEKQMAQLMRGSRFERSAAVYGNQSSSATQYAQLRQELLQDQSELSAISITSC